MKLSKGFNKVLSLVLAGAMVLTGISVADTKKADAADETYVKVTVNGQDAPAAVKEAIPNVSLFATDDKSISEPTGFKAAIGVDTAALKTALGSADAVLTASDGNGGVISDLVSVLDAEEGSEPHFDYKYGGFNEASENDSKYVIMAGVGDKITITATIGAIPETDNSEVQAIKDAGGLKLIRNQKISIYYPVKTKVNKDFELTTTASAWRFTEEGNWNSWEGIGNDVIEATYNETTQCFDITLKGDLPENMISATAKPGITLTHQVVYDAEANADDDKAGVWEEKIDLDLSEVEEANDATPTTTQTKTYDLSDEDGTYAQVSTIVAEVVKEGPKEEDSDPIQSPDNTSGSGMSGAGASDDATSGGGTATAKPTTKPTATPAPTPNVNPTGGTGKPVALPEEDQFVASIHVDIVDDKGNEGYPRCSLFPDNEGITITGFDQESMDEDKQTQRTAITKTGVYTLTLTNCAIDLGESVRCFAVNSSLTIGQQAKNGLIIKPVEVLYGSSDKLTTFPMSSYYSDDGYMRYSFANIWGDEKANPFKADQFKVAKGEGISVKFVVAYSEEDAEKLVALDSGTTTTTNPTAAPTAKPTNKPVAPTLKVAGKLTMGAKEKVTVKATTNQASVKATSSKTKVVKVSASGKNVKLTAQKKTGSANITVTAGTKKATIKVTVKKAPTKIKVSAVTVKRGKTKNAKVKLTPKKSAAYGGKVTNAKTLKKKKVTVTYANGKVAVKADKKAKKGTYTVKLQTYNKKKASFKVKVK